MIIEADRGTLADGSVRLADFDFDDPNTYIIFAHAGADLQSNLVFQEGQEGYSPNDIPTFFVSLGDSARVQLESVDSDSGTQGLITECSVIPETTNQDGLAGSISAALMHEFGHALGLPDLYSTLTGLPTIGYWGIMDSGTNLAAAIGIDEEDVPALAEAAVASLTLEALRRHDQQQVAAHRGLGDAVVLKHRVHQYELARDQQHRLAVTIAQIARRGGLIAGPELLQIASEPGQRRRVLPIIGAVARKLAALSVE
ncbi:MAG: hypothetical protein GVY22_10165 [Gammaproteobacteria bacterium]|nr:hypothetical protein [Gammaproteobacteria bacterium]